MNFSSQMFFNDISYGNRATKLKKNSLRQLLFYMVVETYSYYEKVRRTMGTTVVSYLLNSWISEYFLKPRRLGANVTVELDLSI